MATGRLPFRADSTVDMMHAVIHDTHRPAREHNKSLPEELSAIIDRAMAKNLADRYQSMQRLVNDLQSVSAAVRLGARGVPDGITVPYVVPKREAQTNPFSRFFNRLFSRKPAASGQPASTPSTEPQEVTGHDFSLKSGPKRTLAVLPFRNLNNDRQADYYGLLFADSLTTELAKIPSLTAVPSSSVAKYHNQTIDPAQARADLGVDVVLMGNYLKAGERLRVTAQLVDAARGGILWSEKIDAGAGDLLSIQDRISERIIVGLSGGQVSADPTDLLKDESEEIRLDAVRMLEFSHDPRALSALVEAIRDPALKVKSAAVRAIVRVGEEAAGPVIGLLNDSVDEGDFLSARFAAKALGLIGDKSISPVLVELLKSEDRFVACEAALALGRLGETKAVPELVALLEDPNGNVRFAAAEALGHICDPASREALQKRLSDDDEGVRAKARWALSRLRIAGRAQEG
jgi:TolB-like protein